MSKMRQWHLFGHRPFGEIFSFSSVRFQSKEEKIVKDEMMLMLR